MAERLEATEMWFLRRMMRMYSLDRSEHMTNATVVNMAGTQRSLLKKIQKRQLEFLGHIVRQENLEQLMVTGKIEGKGSKARQRQIYIGSLSKWIGMSTQELLKMVKDRWLRNSMVAKVLKGQST